MLYTHTKKQTHIIVKSIHSLPRSKAKKLSSEMSEVLFKIF